MISASGAYAAAVKKGGVTISTGKTEKHEQLLRNELLSRESLSTEEAAALLGVSLSTVRRLFLRLESQGDIIRLYGGIRRRNNEYSFDTLNVASADEKLAIARRAMNFFPREGAVYLDGGTTVARMAAQLAARLAADYKPSVTIFTNSIVNLTLLEDKCEVHLIGGLYRPNRRDFSGFLAEETVKQLHFTACFLGADAVSESGGFATTDFETARLNKLVLGVTDLRCVLADSTKLRRNSFVRYSPLEDVSLLITDAPPSPALAKILTHSLTLEIACPTRGGRGKDET